ncbi:hypothetical protein [Amycolatopsis sp. WQ 127309]|uniref:hypothetical protein n=1 Tax=Amycolatopsis sp. WQ 127309 TaxID=2932773 RepID=UPI001FF48AD9|nr:hypothetical protein [Amycolatopsis sp. WQ 127309]UOZ05181.1 hypothetical protein MUY22_41165 [Amycolatopsis sp. WQ 127309]
MHLRARRRSIRFDGHTVTLSVATKSWFIIPGDTKNRFPVEKISKIQHTPPTAWKPGKIVFVVPDSAADVVANVPLFADKLAGNTFLYPYGMRAKVAKFLEAVEKARPQR